MDKNLLAEIERRKARGHQPITVAQLSAELKNIGYKMDRTEDCRCNAVYQSGDHAGSSYPVITTGVIEVNTGMSFAHKDARRDDAFRPLQHMRFHQSHYAIVRGAILEI